MATFNQKLAISASSALLFAAINLPFTYKLTDKYISDAIADESGCPSNLGLVIHTVVFLTLSFLMMGNPFEETGLKLKYSMYGALLFFFFSSPVMYSLVGGILGEEYSTREGCQSTKGVLLHSALYGLALFAVMYFPADVCMTDKVVAAVQSGQV